MDFIRLRGAAVAATWIISAGLVTQNASAAVPPPMGPAGQWNLVFEDEFQSPTLDTTKWLTQYWYQQTVANAFMNPDRMSISDGVLDLKVSNVSSGNVGNGTWRPYTGSMINSYGKFRFQYGVFEVRLKMPSGGQGIDAGAFLLNDSGPGKDVWPPEIDNIETLSASPKMAVMTYHWRQNGVHLNSAGWYKNNAIDFSQDFHTFTVDWEPSYIRWYIDGILRFQYTDAAHITNLPMYIVIDPSVCGAKTGWCTAPVGDAIFPVHMKVSYVRVWQH